MSLIRIYFISLVFLSPIVTNASCLTAILSEKQTWFRKPSTRDLRRTGKSSYYLEPIVGPVRPGATVKGDFETLKKVIPILKDNGVRLISEFLGVEEVVIADMILTEISWTAKTTPSNRSTLPRLTLELISRKPVDANGGYLRVRFSLRYSETKNQIQFTALDKKEINGPQLVKIYEAPHSARARRTGPRSHYLEPVNHELRSGGLASDWDRIQLSIPFWEKAVEGFGIKDQPGESIEGITLGIKSWSSIPTEKMGEIRIIKNELGISQRVMAIPVEFF